MERAVDGALEEMASSGAELIRGAMPETGGSMGDALARRDGVRDAIVAFLDDNGLDALAYPTARRPPAPVGGSQDGSSCATASMGGLHDARHEHRRAPATVDGERGSRGGSSVIIPGGQSGSLVWRTEVLRNG